MDGVVVFFPITSDEFHLPHLGSIEKQRTLVGPIQKLFSITSEDAVVVFFSSTSDNAEDRHSRRWSFLGKMLLAFTATVAVLFCVGLLF